MANDQTKKDLSYDAEKDQVIQELGDVTTLEVSLSAEDDRRILRQIDMKLLPLMAVSYLFQFLDKSALGYTAIMSLRTDLSLSGSQYSWASGIYYVGYLVASYPAGWLIVRLPVGKVIAGSMQGNPSNLLENTLTVYRLIWGIALTLTALCFNAAGLLSTRFFLGVTESAIGPGLTVIVAMWYKRSEQPLRHGAWFMGNVIAGIFGGLVAYGVGHVKSIAPWKAVFIVFGLLTVAWSAVIYFFLADTPMNARFLSEEDRVKAVVRVRDNKTGIKNNQWKPKQSIEAALDIKVWLLVLIQLSAQIANGGVHGFGSIVIKGMGFSTLNTLLVQMLSHVFQLVYVLIGTAGSTYFTNSRTYFMAWNLALSIVGSAMVREISDDHMWASFFGYCLTIAYSANFPLVLSISSGNIGGFTKKTTVNAMVFIAYCAGNIIGPQLFFDSEAPSYPSGFLSMLVCFSAAFFFCFVLRFYLIWENKRRDSRVAPSLDPKSDQQDAIATDYTDKEIESFRYVY